MNLQLRIKELRQAGIHRIHRGNREHRSRDTTRGNLAHCQASCRRAKHDGKEEAYHRR